MMMTADDDGRSAFDHAVALLRKLRGYWLLTTFALGAFLWFHDTWQAHRPLPGIVADHGARLDALEAADPRRPTAGQGEGALPGPAPVTVFLLPTRRAEKRCPSGASEPRAGPQHHRLR